MSLPYLPIYGIYLPFQVNLYVPNSKPSNKILFCMLERLMYQLGLSISSILGGLFSRWWTPLIIHEKMAGNRDAQSHAQIKIIANKTPPRLLLVGGTRCFTQAMDWCLLEVGEYKLNHFVWEPPIMCAAWKVSRSLGCYVDNESILLKILFTSISKLSSGTSTNPCFPLRRAYLFTFMLSHHPLIKRHPLESTVVICINYC